MLITDSKREKEWRVIYKSVDSTVLCQTNTSKLVLKEVKTDSLIKTLENQELFEVPETSPINDKLKQSEASLKSFNIKKEIAKLVDEQYAPTYLELKGRKQHRFIKELTEITGYSRATVLKVIRRYLQSGMQEYSLLDNRSYGKMPEKLKYTSKSISARQPGVTFEGLHYIPTLDEIGKIRYELQNKRIKIDIRYDPRDVSQIYYLDRSNILHTFDLNMRIPENSSYVGMTWEHYREIRKKGKEMDKQNERNRIQNRIYLLEGVNNVVKEASINKDGTANNTKDMRQARKKEKELISNANNFGDKLQKTKEIKNVIDVSVKETVENEQTDSTQNEEWDLSLLEKLDKLDEGRRRIALSALDYIFDDD